AGDDRDPFVEQADERAHEPGLALAALAQKDDVVPGEQGALQLGYDGVVEADDAGERGFAGAEAAEQVGTDLLLDGSSGVTGVAEFAERGWRRRRGSHISTLRRVALPPCFQRSALS